MKSLNLLVLRCRDLEKSKAFYEILGLRFVLEHHGNGPKHYSHHDERGVFELYPAGELEPAERTGLGFSTADLELVHEHFHSAGFEPEPILERSWGMTFLVRDPDGRRIEVKDTD